MVCGAFPKVKGQWRLLGDLNMLHLSTFGIHWIHKTWHLSGGSKFKKIIESIDFVFATRLLALSLLSLLHCSPPDKYETYFFLRYRLNIWPVPWSELETNILGFDKDKDEASTWISCRAPWWEACETWASTSRRWGSWSRSSTTGRTCLNRTSLAGQICGQVIWPMYIWSNQQALATSSLTYTWAQTRLSLMVGQQVLRTDKTGLRTRSLEHPFRKFCCG